MVIPIFEAQASSERPTISPCIRSLHLKLVVRTTSCRLAMVTALMLVMCVIIIHTLRTLFSERSKSLVKKRQAYLLKTYSSLIKALLFFVRLVRITLERFTCEKLWNPAIKIKKRLPLVVVNTLMTHKSNEELVLGAFYRAWMKLWLLWIWWISIEDLVDAPRNILTSPTSFALVLNISGVH